MKSPEPQQDALEAWKRRKNYDPLAAAGRKKSAGLTRKHSAGSSVSGVRSPPQDDTSHTSESESLRERGPTSRLSPASRQAASAPGSAKSRSSGSSGYISRGTERLRRQEAERSSSATPVSRAVTAPLRRLAHTNSSSAMTPKQSSNRSSSSLTSKEAEFQAWKRRKNYDPMKAASKSSSKAKESRKVSTESCRSYSSSTTATVEPVRESPRHKRLVDMSSREMTKSLVMEELTMDTPMQRSNSFHCNAKKNGRHQSEDESEDDFGSGYESSLADSQIRSYPHFYLDDDELIMPIQPIQSSHSRLSSGHRWIKHN